VNKLIKCLPKSLFLDKYGGDTTRYFNIHKCLHL